MKTPNAKKIFAALAAVATVTAVAAPAAAQPYGYDRHDQRYDRRYEDSRYHNGWTSYRVQTAERRIDSGLRSGQLTRREAARLRDELHDFARLEARARRGGMSGWERAQVERRWDQLIAAIRYETRDREYGYGYGYRR
ncbi:hypothetical protein [Phenylobacterium sp.]|jgi:hypothetical protein|uniref:hypothetical protein n=1 Tax=Phenylobacterium sp. TaxID=1871053 RepID=UPI002ED94D31